MVKNKKSVIAQELEEIFKGKELEHANNYISIRDNYKSSYGWPELDPIRWEICMCIICGYFQASITLTNHLVESLLKYALIYSAFVKKKYKKKTSGIVSSLIEDMQPGIEKYDSENMYDNIEHAYKIGLINEIQKNRLHKLRKNFRNPYNHADKGKIFGESTIPIQGLEFKNESFAAEKENIEKIKNLPFIQGLIQIEHSKKFAIPYFIEIDTLVRKIMAKVLKN